VTGILDQYVALAVETTYGTAVVSGLRGYESDVDGFSLETEYIKGGGKRAGRPGGLYARSKKINRGVVGRIESIMLDSQEGLRLQHMLGSAKSIAGAGALKTQEYNANTDGPAGSYTAVVARAMSDGTLQYFQYTGLVATGFSVSCDQGGAVTLGIDYIGQAETVLKTAPTKPSYVAAGTMLTFEGCTLKVGGASFSGVTSFSFEADLMMDPDRYFLEGSELRKKPLRNGVPTYTGTLSCEFDDIGKYNNFVGGASFAIEFNAEGGADVESGKKAFFKISLPACQFTGSTPEATVDALSTIELPFEALANSSNEICAIQYGSKDTAP